MNRFLRMLLLLIVLGGCSSTNESTDPFVQNIYSDYPELKYQRFHVETVERVVDGDTFVTAEDVRVRLIGVDTPESTNTVEYFGKEASNFSSRMLTGKKVYLFKDAGDQDRYGRLLRYVFIEGEPSMFNELLVKEGYANSLTVPPNVMFADLFVASESKARKGRRGLWNTETSSQVQTTDAACENPKIKGNINTKGEKIYHMPDGRYYESTKAEAMFCTEEEAVAAGFRKSKQ